MRVVSLVPSATESLARWGVDPVACTRFCMRPDLAHVGGTKDPDLDEIVRLRPDLVVMCEEENLLDHHEHFVAAGLDTFTFRIDTVDDVAPQLLELAERIGVESQTATLPDIVPKAGTFSRRAFVPIWRRPWMSLAAGTYGASVLAHLGVANIFDDAVTRYPEVTLEDAAARHPDVVLAPTEPYPFAQRHLAELSAVAPARLVNGEDLFWWGVRTPEALVRLRSVVSAEN